jgi:cytosine/adenosine deaminase-related metal-dependent hydrolase
MSPSGTAASTTEEPSSQPADLILAGATVLDLTGLRRDVDVYIRDGVIDRVISADAPRRWAKEVIDYREGLIVPAYTNTHHHFATGLLRLRPPGSPTANQRERLERVIWPFERQLTQEDVRLAVRMGLVEAIRAGTTIVIDHHVSGSCIPGILDVIAEEVLASGVRAILCYEISDRDGSEIAAAAAQENERFLRSLVGDQDGVGGMVGLHAMSTVGPESLARAVGLAQRFNVGLHLHLAESDHDNVDSVTGYGQRPVARLAAADALNSRTLVAHAIHLSDDERGLLAERSVMVAHCPRSNASNGVGLADLDALHAAGLLVGVGGNGFTQDMRADTDLLTLLQRLEQRRSAALPITRQLDIVIDGSAVIADRIAGWRTGRVEAGYQADLIGLQYEPLVPLLAQNAMGHYSRGFPSGTVWDVWSRGRRLLRKGEFQTIDQDRIRSEIKRYVETRSQ